MTPTFHCIFLALVSYLLLSFDIVAANTFPAPGEPACHSYGSPRVCNPDNLMSEEDIAYLDAAIQRFEQKSLLWCEGSQVGLQFGVYVEQTSRVATASSVRQTGTDIHHQWGVGQDTLCGATGILLYLAVDSRQMYFSRGGALRSPLSDRTLRDAMQFMKPLLQHDLYVDAIRSALQVLHLSEPVNISKSSTKGGGYFGGWYHHHSRSSEEEGQVRTLAEPAKISNSNTRGGVYNAGSEDEWEDFPFVCLAVMIGVWFFGGARLGDLPWNARGKTIPSEDARNRKSWDRNFQELDETDSESESSYTGQANEAATETTRLWTPVASDAAGEGATVPTGKLLTCGHVLGGACIGNDMKYHSFCKDTTHSCTMCYYYASILERQSQQRNHELEGSAFSNQRIVSSPVSAHPRSPGPSRILSPAPKIRQISWPSTPNVQGANCRRY